MKRPWVSNAIMSARASFSLISPSARRPGGEPLDQPLVDADSFAVLLRAIGLRDVAIAVDQARQVHRHQPPRVLRIGVERVDPLQRLPERGKRGADRVELGLGGSGQGGALR